MTVFAYDDSYKTNADLIEACVTLGYLAEDRLTYDPTFGEGTFWKSWRPKCLIASDYKGAKSPLGYSVDVTALPFPDQSFDDVVVDLPYKLNGTPDPAIDERYGVEQATKWKTRMALLGDGLIECCRVAKGFVLFKCQDQVCSGKVRWQTFEMSDIAGGMGFGLFDLLEYPSYRPQPDGRSQKHARRNFSSLMVFKRGHDPRK